MEHLDEHGFLTTPMRSDNVTGFGRTMVNGHSCCASPNPWMLPPGGIACAGGHLAKIASMAYFYRRYYIDH